MQKRQHNPSVAAYEVRTRGVQNFRRAGIEFGHEPKTVQVADLSPEQLVELLNTDALHVDEVLPIGKAKHDVGTGDTDVVGKSQTSEGEGFGSDHKKGKGK